MLDPDKVHSFVQSVTSGSICNFFNASSSLTVMMNLGVSIVPICFIFLIIVVCHLAQLSLAYDRTWELYSAEVHWCPCTEQHLYRAVTINLDGESITAWDWNMFHTTCQTSVGKVIWNIYHADIPTAPSQVFASSHCWISLSKEHTSLEKKYFYMVWWKTICFYIFPVQQESYTILHISISVLTMLQENWKVFEHRVQHSPVIASWLVEF